MTTEQFKAYEQWANRLSDRELTALWVKHCAPTEIESMVWDTDRAIIIHNAMIARGLM